MKYRTFDEMQRVADIADVGKVRLSRRERLERWADVLMQDPKRILRPLYRLEFMSAQERMLARGDGTPLALAYADQVLREDGLTGDRVGDAMVYFDISHRDMHFLVCACHCQGDMTAANVAAQIRSMANRVTLREVWQRLRGRLAAALG